MSSHTALIITLEMEYTKNNRYYVKYTENKLSLSVKNEFRAHYCTLILIHVIPYIVLCRDRYIILYVYGYGYRTYPIVGTYTYYII